MDEMSNVPFANIANIAIVDVQRVPPFCRDEIYTGLRHEKKGELSSNQQLPTGKKSDAELDNRTTDNKRLTLLWSANNSRRLTTIDVLTYFKRVEDIFHVKGDKYNDSFEFPKDFKAQKSKDNKGVEYKQFSETNDNECFDVSQKAEGHFPSKIG
ncbi:hypothetical protein Fot_16946 [Forsythia ovata]|uniref:Uncharacterized protein n=1 Tax=Forsythia ovata TaxID=205694 RepID=A0ABD1VDZ0_9LAMI